MSDNLYLGCVLGVVICVLFYLVVVHPTLRERYEKEAVVHGHAEYTLVEDKAIWR